MFHRELNIHLVLFSFPQRLFFLSNVKSPPTIGTARDIPPKNRFFQRTSLHWFSSREPPINTSIASTSLESRTIVDESGFSGAPEFRSMDICKTPRFLTCSIFSMVVLSNGPSFGGEVDFERSGPASAAACSREVVAIINSLGQKMKAVSHRIIHVLERTDGEGQEEVVIMEGRGLLK